MRPETCLSAIARLVLRSLGVGGRATAGDLRSGQIPGAACFSRGFAFGPPDRMRPADATAAKARRSQRRANPGAAISGGRTISRKLAGSSRGKTGGWRRSSAIGKSALTRSPWAGNIQPCRGAVSGYSPRLVSTTSSRTKRLSTIFCMGSCRPRGRL